MAFMASSWIDLSSSISSFKFCSSSSKSFSLSHKLLMMVLIALGFFVKAVHHSSCCSLKKSSGWANSTFSGLAKNQSLRLRL
jgi:hypothetical protein